IGRHFVALPAYAALYELGTAVAAGLIVAALTIAGGLLSAVVGTAIGCLLVWQFAAWALVTRNTFFSPGFPILSAMLSLAVLAVAKVVHERGQAETEKRRRQQAYRFIVQSLTSLTEARDVDTGRHARRTQGYMRLVAGLLLKSPRFRSKLTPETVELMS